jgi:hypothetical protein
MVLLCCIPTHLAGQGNTANSIAAISQVGSWVATAPPDPTGPARVMRGAVPGALHGTAVVGPSSQQHAAKHN